MPDTYLLWTDVETTGTDATTCHLLEVAAMITDYDLNLVTEESYSAVVRYSPETVTTIRDETVPFVVDMHDKTGLWDRLTSPEAKSMGHIDAELRAFLHTVTGGEKKIARMAGNSIRLDLNFVEKNLPDTYADLHYRMFDVSTLAVAAAKWRGAGTFRKELAHTAVGDIRESLAEARYLKECFG